MDRLQNRGLLFVVDVREVFQQILTAEQDTADRVSQIMGRDSQNVAMLCSSIVWPAFQVCRQAIVQRLLEVLSQSFCWGWIGAIRLPLRIQISDFHQFTVN